MKTGKDTVFGCLLTTVSTGTRVIDNANSHLQVGSIVGDPNTVVGVAVEILADLNCTGKIREVLLLHVPKFRNGWLFEIRVGSSW